MRLDLASPLIGLAALALAVFALQLERLARSGRDLRLGRVAVIACLVMAAFEPVLYLGNTFTVLLVPDALGNGADSPSSEATLPSTEDTLTVRYGLGDTPSNAGEARPVLGPGEALAALIPGLARSSRVVVSASNRWLAAETWPAGAMVDEAWWEVLPPDLASPSRRVGLVSAAKQAAARGIVVDALGRYETDAHAFVVTGLSSAPLAWPGEPIPLTLHLRASHSMSLTVEWSLDGEVVASQPFAAVAGLNELTRLFDGPAIASSAGTGAVADTGDAYHAHSLAARVTGPDDGSETSPRPAGSGRGASLPPGTPTRRSRIVFVTRPPSLLIIGDDSGAVRLADVFSQAGMATEVVGPSNAPTSRRALGRFDAAVLVDQPADAFGTDQLAAMADFVTRDGRGLILVGGRQSYLAGGWEGTPLERIAPVRLEPPEREEHAVVALLLLIDTSASMGSVEGRAAMRKIDLAREAALLASDPLRPGDLVGVVAYADDATWLSPFTALGADARGQASRPGLVGSLATAGGTHVLSGLQLGLPALAATSATTRHAVLVSDGRDAAPDEAAIESLLASSRAGGTTLSTIAIGADADAELLARLARLGGGRFHKADDPGDLPRLALEESKLVRAHALQQGRTTAREALPGHAALVGVEVGQLAPLAGYVALSRRRGAEVVLETTNGDPLVATWNLGAGRVVAWAGDAGDAWATGWFGSGAGQAFWRRLAQFAARRPQADGVSSATLQTEQGPMAIVDLKSSDGEPSTDATVHAALGRPDAEGWPALAGGMFGATLPLSDEAEAWMVRVERKGDVPDADVIVPMAVAPPAPAWPAQAAAAGNGVLVEVAAAGGGRVLNDRSGLPRSNRPSSLVLWPFLTALAALTWVLHVAQLVGRWSPRRLVAKRPA